MDKISAIAFPVHLFLSLSSLIRFIHVKQYFVDGVDLSAAYFFGIIFILFYFLSFKYFLVGRSLRSFPSSATTWRLQNRFDYKNISYLFIIFLRFPRPRLGANLHRGILEQWNGKQTVHRQFLLFWVSEQGKCRFAERGEIIIVIYPFTDL